MLPRHTGTPVTEGNANHKLSSEACIVLWWESQKIINASLWQVGDEFPPLSVAAAVMEPKKKLKGAIRAPRASKSKPKTGGPSCQEAVREVGGLPSEQKSDDLLQGLAQGPVAETTLHPHRLVEDLIKDWHLISIFYLCCAVLGWVFPFGNALLQGLGFPAVAGASNNTTWGHLRSQGRWRALATCFLRI